jgi:hypothetical protein
VHFADALASMNASTIRCVAFSAMLMVLCGPASAAPIGINIVTAAYTLRLTSSTTDNTTDPSSPLTETKAQVVSSLVPTSDSLLVTAPSGSMALAEGYADLFSTTVHTESGSRFGDHAGAQAEVDALVEFTPIADGTGSIGIDMLARFQSQFSEGFVSLVDLSLGAGLWRYSWDQFQATDTLPWVLANGTFSSSFIVDSSLIASHKYRLEMFTATNSNNDEQLVTLGISGVKAVPEPSILALLFTAAVPAILRRRFMRRSVG